MNRLRSALRRLCKRNPPVQNSPWDWPSHSTVWVTKHHRRARSPSEAGIQLSPDNQYIHHALLALTLRKAQKQAEGDKLVEEALKKTPCPTDGLCSAAKYYRNKLSTRLSNYLKRVLESVPNNVYQHLQIGRCYRAKIQQIQRSRRCTTKGNEEELQEMTRHMVGPFKRAVELNMNPPHACSDLACLYAITGQYDEVGYYFQKEFRKDLPPAERQELHLCYRNFQEYQRLHDDTAIRHCLQGLNINGTMTEKEKLIVNLRKIAHKRLSENASDAVGWQLSRFIRELNRKGQPRGSPPAEAGGVVPSGPRAEKGSEEMTEGAGGAHHPEEQKGLGRAHNQSSGLQTEKSQSEGKRQG